MHIADSSMAVPSRASRLLALVAVSAAVLACKGEPSGSGSSSAPAGSAAPAKKAAITQLSGKQLDAAYDAAVKGGMTDPFDKKKAKVVGQLGQPHKSEGQTLIWYGITPATAVMPESCRELRISPDGAASLDSVAGDVCYGAGGPSGPGASPGGAAASPATTGASAAAAGATAAAAADYADLTGDWSSDWGKVTINGNTGSYTDTYSGGPGKLEFTKKGDRQYTAVWSESKQRHGTMNVTLSADGTKLTGKWTPDADVTVGTKAGGAINWTKKGAARGRR